MKDKGHTHVIGPTYIWSPEGNQYKRRRLTLTMTHKHAWGHKKHAHDLQWSKP